MWGWWFPHLESEEEVEEEPEERQASPEPLQESPNSTTYYEPHPVAYAKTSSYLKKYSFLWFTLFKK